MQRGGKGVFVLQDDGVVVAEAYAWARDDLDLVVGAFEPGGVNRGAAVIDDPVLVPARVADEGSPAQPSGMRKKIRPRNNDEGRTRGGVDLTVLAIPARQP